MSESDRELLELAAKAAGYKFTHAWSDKFAVGDTKDDLDLWNPLRDDGDALRLAVKLQISIFTPRDSETPVGFHKADGASANSTHGWVHSKIENDGALAATRRAIVIAAAEIGKS